MKTLDKISDSAHDAYDKVASAGSRAVDVLGEKNDQLRSTEQQLIKDCRSYISHNPITSVGIAAVVGILLSRVTSRR
jgi:ElaB/YqjD/DUF883 family membrane-anchored ribosome-binding protein